MTDQEIQQLKWEVDALKARFDAQHGADPSALHPHGSRESRRSAGGDNTQETAQENVNRLFERMGAVEKGLATEKAWHMSLRGEKGVEVNGNVISGPDLSTGDSGGGSNAFEYHTFIISNNGAAEYWAVAAVYLGIV